MVDADHGELPQTIKLPGAGVRPMSGAVARWLHTADGPSNTVSVVDAASMHTVATVKVGPKPWGVAVGPGK